MSRLKTRGIKKRRLMQGSWSRLWLILMLSLIPLSQSTWAEPQSLDLSCLNRQYKQPIEICFEQNSACHAALKVANTPPPSEITLQEVLLYVGSGLLSGMILEHQMEKH